MRRRCCGNSFGPVIYSYTRVQALADWVRFNSKIWHFYHEIDA